MSELMKANMEVGTYFVSCAVVGWIACSHERATRRAGPTAIVYNFMKRWLQVVPSCTTVMM